MSAAIEHAQRVIEGTTSYASVFDQAVGSYASINLLDKYSDLFSFNLTRVALSKTARIVFSAELK